MNKKLLCLAIAGGLTLPALPAFAETTEQALQQLREEMRQMRAHYESRINKLEQQVAEQGKTVVGLQDLTQIKSAPTPDTRSRSKNSFNRTLK